MSGLCQMVGFCIIGFECWDCWVIVGEHENSLSGLCVVLVLIVATLFVRLRILCQGYVLCCWC